MDKVSLYTTPESWEDLEAWIELHNSDEKPHLYTAAMMAWNLACDISKKEKEDE